jgi:hypothetical protein
MPSFGKLFIESKGQPISYGGNTLILADKFPVSNGDILVVSIEKANSDPRQGAAIDITGHCEIDDKVFKQGKGVMMLFWADTADNPTKIKVFTKKDYVWVKNIWESTNHMGRKSIDSGHNGAAMIVEEIENGRRYRCNDGTPDDDFDDIIFTVQKLKQ